jgi:hypothetical protein
MNKTKRTRLDGAGWSVGCATDFLGLSPEEAALVETRLALSQAVRSRRIAHGLTQGELARRLKSSQSRVAKMEAGDKTISVDLLVRALFSLGAKPRDIGRALQRRGVAAYTTC